MRRFFFLSFVLFIYVNFSTHFGDAVIHGKIIPLNIGNTTLEDYKVHQLLKDELLREKRGADGDQPQVPLPYQSQERNGSTEFINVSDVNPGQLMSHVKRSHREKRVVPKGQSSPAQSPVVIPGALNDHLGHLCFMAFTGEDPIRGAKDTIKYFIEQCIQHGYNPNNIGKFLDKDFFYDRYIDTHSNMRDIPALYKNLRLNVNRIMFHVNKHELEIRVSLLPFFAEYLDLLPQASFGLTASQISQFKDLRDFYRTTVRSYPVYSHISASFIPWFSFCSRTEGASSSDKGAVKFQCQSNINNDVFCPKNCFSSCPNNAIYAARNIPISQVSDFYIKQTKSRGIALKANRPFVIGEFLLEHSGLVQKTTIERRRTYATNYNKNGVEKLVLNQQKVGGLSRFINSGCTPNVGLFEYTVDNELVIVVMAIQPIRKDDELFLLYNVKPCKCPVCKNVDANKENNPQAGSSQGKQ